MRTLDLAVVLSFVVSLYAFNRGNVFLSTPLIYPPMIYLDARMVWIGWRRTPRTFAIGDRHLLRPGRAHLRAHGVPAGPEQPGLERDRRRLRRRRRRLAAHARRPALRAHARTATASRAAGRYFNGDPIGYIQTDGRCESPIESGDTYGPAVYVAYVPAVAAMGWSGRWDRLPAAHVAASAFDILAVVGLFVAGWRLGSRRLGVALAFAWAANPFTLYSLNMNSNDALVGALLAWTLALLVDPGRPRGDARRGRPHEVRTARDGAAVRVAAEPDGDVRRLRRRRAAAALDARPRLRTASSLFWHRTIDYQLGRVTPMSIWTLGIYHPGWWDLRLPQHAFQIAVVLGIVALAVFPRRRAGTRPRWRRTPRPS